VKFITSIYNWLQTNISLPSAFSWETLIVLSLFSYYMAFLARSTQPDGFVGHLLVNLGWIFLILGVYWGTTINHRLRPGYKFPERQGFPLSPWFTGALASIYLFGVLSDETGRVIPEMLIFWPMISAILAILPDYIAEGGKMKSPPAERRKYHLLLFASQVLLSCWFQFHFVVQNYLAQYPSLRADTFNKSAFVVKWDALPINTRPRGALLLEQMEAELRKQFEGRPWAEVERLLLQKEREQLIDSTAAKAKKELVPTQEESNLLVVEDELWDVNSKISARRDGYNLDLQAVWQGPRSGTQSNAVTKSCQITPQSLSPSVAAKPLNTPAPTSPTVLSSFNCQEVKGWGVEAPIIASE
jgi:hypothetical protein